MQAVLRKWEYGRCRFDKGRQQYGFKSGSDFVITPVYATKNNFTGGIVNGYKEVANRLSANVGSKEYGQITVLLDYYFDINKVIDVDRKCFYPMPNVDSAVIKMTRKEKLEKLTSFEHFDKLVKDSFQFKRKTIKNNLINKYNLDIVSKVLEKYGYDLSMRSEKIPYYVFVEISNELLK